MFDGHNLGQGSLYFKAGNYKSTQIHTHTQSSISSCQKNLFTREGKKEHTSSQLPYIFTCLFQKKSCLNFIGICAEKQVLLDFWTEHVLRGKLIYGLWPPPEPPSKLPINLLSTHQNWGWDTANLSTWHKLLKEICWQAFWLMLVKLLQCLSPLLAELFQLQQAARVNQDSRD